MARAALKAQAALDAGSDETSFYRAKLATARFYMDQILPRAQAHGLGDPGRRGRGPSAGSGAVLTARA
jgi:hypothetical protein